MLLIFHLRNVHHAGLQDAGASDEKGATVNHQTGSRVRVIALYEKRWMRIEEAAEYLGVTLTAMKAAVRNGEIPHVLFGRRYIIDRRAIDAYLEGLQSTNLVGGPQ
jgi:excisionase family DNA binding protein